MARGAAIIPECPSQFGGAVQLPGQAGASDSRNERAGRWTSVHPDQDRRSRGIGMMQPGSKTAGQAAATPLPRAVRARVQRHRGLWIRLIHVVLFGSSVAAAWGLSLALSAGASSGKSLESIADPLLLAALVASKAVTFELFRLHRASWRWFGLPDAATVTVANTSGSVLGALVLGPRIAAIGIAALLVIEWLLSQALLLGSRMLVRLLLEAAGKRRGSAPRKRALIYGAGRRGLNLLRQIRDNPAMAYEIAGFIDDDPAKRHLMMQMTPVLGNGDELPRLARLHQVDEILIAVQSPGRTSRGRFLELARFAGLPCRFPKRLAATPRGLRRESASQSTVTEVSE